MVKQIVISIGVLLVICALFYFWQTRHQLYQHAAPIANEAFLSEEKIERQLVAIYDKLK